MEALAAHLKRRNLKILQQQLSLPKIPEVTTNQFTKTSMRLKKARPVVKYVSETTFSPEQQHVHDQLRMMLQKRAKAPLDENSRIMELLKGAEPIREKKILPKIKESNAVTPKRQTPDCKESRRLSSRRKSKSVNTKIGLDGIMQDQHEFIKNYFAQINDRMRR